MQLGLALTVLILVIAVFFVFKMLQETLDIAHIIVSVLGIVLTVSFLGIVYDAYSFKRSFSESESIVVVRESGVYKEVFQVNGNGSLDRERILALMNAGNVREARGSYYKIITVDSNSSFRGNVGSLFDDPGLLLSEYKKGLISVYPESYFFKAIRFVPGSGSLGIVKDYVSSIRVRLNATI